MAAKDRQPTKALTSGKKGEGNDAEDLSDQQLCFCSLLKEARVCGGETPFDICMSLGMMIVLLPVCLVVAVIVAIDTKSTPLFIQTRVGRGNRPFRMLKFRTMSPKTPQNVATYLLKDVDRYISRTGRLVRKLSLDELPQLWNIFKGDMSFVGPRPVVLTETELLSLRTSKWCQRSAAWAYRLGAGQWP